MKKLFFIYIIILSIPIYSQMDQQIGRMAQEYRYYGNYYDYSDPTTINIKVSVWGYVRSPGKYIVPIYTTIPDLMSYAGGPVDQANLDDIRIYRTSQDGKEELIQLNYTDLLHENELNEQEINPNIKASDILIVPGSPKYYFRDYLSISLSIFSALVSLTILILNLNR